MTKQELAKLRNELGPMWSYSDDNPTGHYKLNLGSNFDRELACKVRLSFCEGKFVLAVADMCSSAVDSVATVELVNCSHLYTMTCNNPKLGSNGQQPRASDPKG